jgi:hypothetical protein
LYVDNYSEPDASQLHQQQEALLEKTLLPTIARELQPRHQRCEIVMKSAKRKEGARGDTSSFCIPDDFGEKF